jgi:Arc/MetJ-type ribon-helix-helix transcriptional regulator
MTIHLPKDVERSINEAVMNGRFASMDDAMTEAAQLLLERLKQGQTTPKQSTAAHESPAGAREPVWERILKRTAAIPDKEWDKLPTDLAEQHDHYLYGVPKRPTP